MCLGINNRCQVEIFLKEKSFDKFLSTNTNYFSIKEQLSVKLESKNVDSNKHVLGTRQSRHELLSSTESKAFGQI